jgi:hypothetical protein
MTKNAGVWFVHRFSLVNVLERLVRKADQNRVFAGGSSRRRR